jgi:RNA polymerase sigma-B factor
MENSNPPIPAALTPDVELTLIHRYQVDGDENALQELVTNLMPWLRRVAGRYSNRGLDTDDLVQVGSVGLLKAIQRFDPERGVRLVAYAEPTVTGEIKRHFRDHAWAVRPPRDLQELNAEVITAIDFLSSDRHHSPTVAEIAKYLSTDEEAVLEAMHAGGGYRAKPLTILDDDDSSESESAIVATDDLGLARSELRNDLGAGLAGLAERDRQVLHMRFFEDLTQSEIADRIEVSQMQVSRILRSALQTLRKNLPEINEGDYS